MTQEERREYLLKYLLKEDLRFRGEGCQQASWRRRDCCEL